jgi:hypothetical protein
MAFHHCTISLEDGNVVAGDVQLALEEADRDADKWYGTITASQEMMLAAGQRYRLTLDDGRSGTFLVRRNTSAGDAGRAIAIHGVGPLAEGAR